MQSDMSRSSLFADSAKCANNRSKFDHNQGASGRPCVDDFYPRRQP